MKTIIQGYIMNNKTKKKALPSKFKYIPIRFILAMLLTIAGTIAILAGVLALCYYIKGFYTLIVIMQILCSLVIINSQDNPEYKVPWLVVILTLPIVGVVLYAIFYSRKLSIIQVKRLKNFRDNSNIQLDYDALKELSGTDAFGQAKVLCESSRVNLYKNTKSKYFSSGEEIFTSMLTDLSNAKKFIFLEYFIIQRGIFWNSILEILKDKAANGVEVRVIYDDIGCMRTLPSLYFKTLQKYNIKAVPFALLKGNVNNEFNNRSHRKMMIIDGDVAYTGGINIADEYINKVEKFGHWKDSGVKIEGEAVKELTKLFLADYQFNTVKPIEGIAKYLVSKKVECNEYVIPFGDGPTPIYEQNVGKNAILNIVNQSKNYVYITSPYLIVDNEILNSLENAAKRGVDVKIITPNIPDKKIIQLMSRSYYPRLIKSNVKIYEYLPGFIHSKSIISDDDFAIVGTINLDYRSLVHHFENGIWFYKSSIIEDIKQDINQAIEKCKAITIKDFKENIIQKFIRSTIKVFAPLL